MQFFQLLKNKMLHMRNKTTRLIVSGVMAAIILYIGYVLFSFTFFSHHFVHDYQKHLWVFKDSVRNEIDTFIYNGYEKKEDILYYYLYKRNYQIAVWEFKDLDVVPLRNILINQNVNLDGVKIGMGERLNKKAYPSPTITLKFSYDFNYVLNINLDNYSKIIKKIDSSNYKGFYGNINKMSFSNRRGEHVILFDYYCFSEPTFFLVYKANKSFYVIIINSEVPFDEGIISILNLH